MSYMPATADMNQICNSSDTDGDNQFVNELVVEKTRLKPKKPPLYKVLLLNDDFTPMEFVVLLLMRFFNLDEPTAVRIMLQVHTIGVGVCGVFTREIAETKAKQVMNYANQNKHPLQCTLEIE